MVTMLQKSKLRNGYYYSGFVSMHFTVISQYDVVMVMMWDAKINKFVYWQSIDNIKHKCTIEYLGDIRSSNEISAGFFPMKEIIPKSEHIIE